MYSTDQLRRQTDGSIQSSVGDNRTGIFVTKDDLRILYSQLTDVSQLAASVVLINSKNTYLQLGDIFRISYYFVSPSRFSSIEESQCE